jgi:mRNA interferase MazF
MIGNGDFRRFSICIIRLNPVVGSEICKTRPCVIISPNEMNRRLRTIIIAPMTSKGFPYPSRVPIKFKNKEGLVLLDQIRTVDKQRIVDEIGELKNSEAKAVSLLLQEMFCL